MARITITLEDGPSGLFVLCNPVIEQVIDHTKRLRATGAEKMAIVAIATVLGAARDLGLNPRKNGPPGH